MSTTEARPLPRRTKRRPLFKRWWFWLIVALFVAIVAAIAWLGARVVETKDALESVIPLATKIQTQVMAGDAAAAQETIDLMSSRTQKARDNTGDPERPSTCPSWART
jgi:hypothetical protein